MLWAKFLKTEFNLSFATHFVRGVAQSGSVLAWGARGRKFESCLPDIVHRSFGNGGLFICLAGHFIFTIIFQ